MKAGIDVVHKATKSETAIPEVVVVHVRCKLLACHVSNLWRNVSSKKTNWLISGGVHNTVCIKYDEAGDVESPVSDSVGLDGPSVIEACPSDLSVMSSRKRRSRRYGGD